MAQPAHQTIPFTYLSIIPNKSAPPTGQSNGGYGTIERKDYLKYAVTLE